MGGLGLVRGGAGTALVGDGPTVARESTNTPRLASTALCFRAIRSGRSVSGRRVAVPTSGCRHSEIPQPQPLNPQGEAVANDFSPVKSRKVKEEIMATPVKKCYCALPPGFYRWASWRCGNWLLSWLAVDAYFALTGRGGDGFWTLSASGELWQHLAISSWRR